MKCTIVLLFLVFSVSVCFCQTLHINVTGIRNTTGNIRLAFYSDSKSFDDEKPLFIRKVSKSKMSGNALLISYTDIKAGLYGIAILDDENTNDKMDYGLILPKEGFGFSDYYHTGMTRPKFESFDFVLKYEVKSVVIRVRYM